MGLLQALQLELVLATVNSFSKFLLQSIKYSKSSIDFKGLLLEIKPSKLGSRIRCGSILIQNRTEVKIIYFVPLCVIVWFTLTLDILYVVGLLGVTVPAIKDTQGRPTVYMIIIYLGGLHLIVYDKR
jgi:hypothetical protein